MTIIQSVYNYIRSCGDKGATCKETVQGIAGMHQTVSSRIFDLRRQGDVVVKLDEQKKPVKRETSGRYSAQVFVVTDLTKTVVRNDQSFKRNGKRPKLNTTLRAADEKALLRDLEGLLKTHRRYGHTTPRTITDFLQTLREKHR